jgi:DNA-binding winged helix-turn-helix (wHTH) protein/Tol biopolymer transport system component
VFPQAWGGIVSKLLSFADIQLDIGSYELRRNGSVLKLEKIPMELLILLVESRGQLVSREKIIAKLWGDEVFVDTEQGINTAIRKIRQALQDDPDHPRFIQTVVGKGYRFVANVNGCALSPTPWHAGLQSRRMVSVAAALLIVAGSLGWVASHNQWEHSPVSEQRVTANPTEALVLGAAISPDGRYVAYLDTTGLYLRETSGGDTHSLPVPKGFVPIPTSWFPDNASFLATWDAGPRQPPSIWRVSILGTPPQKLSDNSWGATVSADGSRVAFLRGGPAPAGNGLEIWTMESNGADQRMVTSVAPGSALGPVAWSPAGKRIAYLRIQPGPVSSEVSLETRDREGVHPATVVLKGSFIDRALCWAPDGRIIYSHVRSEAPNLEDSGLWAIAVEEADGEARGQPQPIRDARTTGGVGWISDLSISRDSKHLTLVRHSAEPQVFVGELERKRPRSLQQPHRLTLDQRANVPFAWTPDSKAVLFISSRNGVWNIFKQAIDQPTAELFVGGEDRIFGPRLSPDGSEILYLVMPRLGGPASEVSLMRVPVAGGPPRLLLREAGICDVQCARFGSTRCILTQQRGGGVVVYSLDPLQGKREALLRLSTGNNFSLSPDGSHLAIIDAEKRGRIQLFSLASHRSHAIVVKGWAELRNVDWSADGRTLFVPATKDERTVALLEIDTQGNAWELLHGPLGWAIPSPDSRYLAFTQFAGENNVWMIQDF